jgi:hypothetical protein
MLFETAAARSAQGDAAILLLALGLIGLLFSALGLIGDWMDRRAWRRDGHRRRRTTASHESRRRLARAGDS